MQTEVRLGKPSFTLLEILDRIKLLKGIHLLLVVVEVVLREQA